MITVRPKFTWDDDGRLVSTAVDPPLGGGGGGGGGARGPAAALDATATPDGCWVLIATGTAPDAPPKRSIAKSVMKIATIGTRNGVLLWWYISHPFSSVNDLDTDVKVLLSS